MKRVTWVLKDNLVIVDQVERKEKSDQQAHKLVAKLLLYNYHFVFVCVCVCAHVCVCVRVCV